MSVPRFRRIAVGVALAAAIRLAYAPVLSGGFTNYDDDEYVTANPDVQGGPTLHGVRWAFTTTMAANWHPLTWLSHMIDCRLFGLEPRGHHFTSLLLHIVNAVLLLVILDKMTGAIWKSAMVAALFALHPLHVESVAWVAERKDVLSGLFFLLTIAAYVRYVAVPGAARYVAVLAAFALGLMAKPMLVTLPFVLLLLDLWPLDRIGRGWSLLVEKLPLLALSAASSVVTFGTQRAGGAFGSAEQYPFSARVANALAAYVAYLRKTIWPADLAVFYPYPRGGPAALEICVAALLLVAITVLALRLRGRLPYLAVGWLWYLGMLVPVIGLVQVGEQSMADRYTYLPLVGIFIVIAWGVPDAVERLFGSTVKARRATAIASVGVLAALAVSTHAQARTWHDSASLFEHALAVTKSNQVAHFNLGLAMEERGDRPRAEEHYRSAIAIRPDYAIARNNLGYLAARQGRWREAIEQYTAALATDPDCAEAHSNLGIALAREGKLEDATAHFAAAIRLKPGDASFHYNWGTALASSKRWDEAIAELREALRLRPGHAEAHYNLAAALYFTDDYAGAWSEVGAARRYGYAPPPAFLAMLSRKMPEPG